MWKDSAFFHLNKKNRFRGHWSAIIIQGGSVLRYNLAGRKQMFPFKISNISFDPFMSPLNLCNFYFNRFLSRDNNIDVNQDDNIKWPNPLTTLNFRETLKNLKLFLYFYFTTQMLINREEAPFFQERRLLLNNFVYSIERNITGVEFWECSQDT